MKKMVQLFMLRRVSSYRMTWQKTQAVSNDKQASISDPTDGSKAVRY